MVIYQKINLKICNHRFQKFIAFHYLKNLSKKYKISRERVRQIEEKAIEKLQKEISNKN